MQCTYNVLLLTMYLQCDDNVLTLYLQCTYNVLTMYLQYTCNVLTLYNAHRPTVYDLLLVMFYLNF